MNLSMSEYEDMLGWVQWRVNEIQAKEGKPHSTSLVLRAFADYCGIHGYELKKAYEVPGDSSDD